MSHPFSYLELHTQDPSRAKAFYSELFGWKLADQPMGGGTYTTIDTGAAGSPGGGLLKAQMPNQPSSWLTYVNVEDLKASTQKAKQLGATALQEDVPVEGRGRFTVLKDPTGATFALWQRA